MKKQVILFVFSLFVFPCLTNAATFGISRPSNNLGLVGYWTFDGKNVVNGVVQDISGNSNIGNLINISTSTFYTQGKIGQGFNFDGVDDYINISDNSILDISGAISIGVWVKTNTTSGTQAIFTKFQQSSADYSQYYISLSSGNFYLGISNGTTLKLIQTTGAPVQPGKWYYLVAVWDGTTNSGGMKVYVNGVLNTTDTSTISNIWNKGDGPTYNLIIGSDYLNSPPGNKYFNGSIDDIRLYSRALSQSEITRLYNTGASNKSAVSPKVNATSTCSVGLSCGLVGYWTFDGKDVVNGAIIDKSGGGSNGNVFNIASSTFYDQGKIGQGFHFDGVNDYVTLGTPSTMDFRGPFTISFWMNPDTLAGDQTLLEKGSAFGAAGDYQYFIHRNPFGNNGSIYFGASDGTNLSTANSNTSFYRENIWTFVTAVYDGSYSYLYKNGVLDSSGVLTTLGPLNHMNSPPEVGAKVSGGNWFFDGSIDDIRGYNRALSAAEILQIYNTGAATKINASRTNSLTNNLIGYYTFDGKDVVNGVALNKAGSSNNGNLISIATSTFYDQGKIGQGFRFDGADDYIDAGTDILGVSALTVSAWIYPNSYGEVSAGKIVNNGSSSFNIAGDFNRIRWTNNGINQGGSANDSVLLNRWTHVLITRTSAGVVNFYVNGVLSGTANQGTGVVGSLTAATENFSIGNRSLKDRTFDGIIDDVRVYSRDLSVSEINNLYNMGR